MLSFAPVSVKQTLTISIIIYYIIYNIFSNFANLSIFMKSILSTDEGYIRLLNPKKVNLKTEQNFNSTL